ncbi:Bug family tripartite tricarboxylate transporter substrate binding protein [Rhodoplanes sp. Z2-YC6860]|uniref:Bug family tripartite tricarboxylate transporter substrate binding protein n=1 Tax=Rhodoplanes sp. Z2-YC6860 TaxID=674703 RepID=UPI00078B1A94|nr:tripartite tricarboxylate transporter substrate binding protein [Rhodoplanes sp. Z2-YC6860]AMN39007.1 TTT family tricarboxylate transporter, receptor protein [Rhodoplanes sp. Z2-YC6860]
MKLIASVFSVVLTAGLLAGGAHAQDYPSRPITFVVGYGAGGGTDINARIFAETISRNIGQSIVVENKTGAGGGLAATFVQNAAPDGYTLLIMSGLQHAYLPASQSKPMYDAIKGFTPISLFFEMISVLAIPYDYPAKTIGEFIEQGKKKVGGVSLGSPGPGSPPHFFGALITEATGLPVQMVQYRGTSNFMADLTSGRIDLAFPTYGVAQSFMTDKKARALAVAADERWSELPDVPTLVEAKLVKEMPAMWFGVVAPAGTPRPIVDRINEEFRKAAKDPELVRRITATGMAVRTSTPEQMGELMVSENAKVGALVERLNLKQ